MNKLLITFFALVIPNLLFCQEELLKNSIHNLVDQVINSKSFEHNKAIAITEFPIQDSKITDLSFYIADEINNYLTDNSTGIVIEQNKVNYSLKETKRDYNKLIDYKYLSALSERIFNNSNIVPQLYLTGALNDLGDKIILFVKILDARTAQTVSQTKIEISSTALTDKLLGKEITHGQQDVEKPRVDTVVIEKEKRVDVPVIQEKVIEKEVKVPVVVRDTIIENQHISNGNIFFKEDFSEYNTGDPVPLWGENVIVIQKEDKKYYITSQIRGNHEVSQNIQFPENFSFQFEYLPGRFGNELIFVDSKDQQLRIQLIQSYRNFVKFPNTTEKSGDVKSVNEFRLVKQGSTFKIYLNGEYLLSYKNPELKNFTQFKMQIPEGRYFSNYIGKEI